MKKAKRKKFEGLTIPVYCPRRRKDCRSLGQVIAIDHVSFVCCGHNRRKTRDIKQDKFRVCWKNEFVDEMGDYDRRDLVNTAQVMLQALSVDLEVGLS